jgi:agmatinase
MPRTILPNSRVSPRFSGICTFCRYPRLEDVSSENRPVDWAIYGVPFDSGVTYRPGARFAPRAIRDASQYVKAYHLAHGVNVCETLSLADAGDAPVKPYHLEENLKVVAQWATDLADPFTRLFAVGGDHTIAYANILAARNRLRATGVKQDKGVALIHFDAHLDTVDEVWGEKWGHASPFRRAIEDGIVDPNAMLSIGLRGPLNREDDLEFARAEGVTIVTADDCDGPEPNAASRAIDPFLDSLGTRPVYVTFDIDCIDPAFAPGTGTPCPGGLTTRDAFSLLRRLRGINLIGADVVEVLPERDPAGVTSFLAAHILFEIIALDAAARAAR